MLHNAEPAFTAVPDYNVSLCERKKEYYEDSVRANYHPVTGPHLFAIREEIRQSNCDKSDMNGMECEDGEDDFNANAFIGKKVVQELYTNGANGMEYEDNVDIFYNRLLLKQCNDWISKFSVINGMEYEEGAEVEPEHDKEIDFNDNKLEFNYIRRAHDSNSKTIAGSIQNTIGKVKHTAGSCIILFCPFCGMELLNSHERRQHINGIHKLNKHENMNMKCTNDTAKYQQCKVDTNSKSTCKPQSHSVTFLPYNRYIKCDLCCELFFWKNSYRRHIKRNCDFKGEKEFKEDSRGGIHFTPICPFCGTEFSNGSAWRHHLYSMHTFSKPEDISMEFFDKIPKCEDGVTKLGKIDVGLFQNHRITRMPYNKFPRGQGFFWKQLNKLNKTNYVYNSQINTTLDCPLCGFDISDLHLWRNHLRSNHKLNIQEKKNEEYHNDDNDEYKQWKFVGNSKKTSSLQKNKMKHLPYDRYIESKLSGKRFSSIIIHKRRMSQYDNTKDSRQCGNPSNTTYSETKLPVLCPFCGTEFSNFYLLREHLSTAHESNKQGNLDKEDIESAMDKCEQCKNKLKIDPKNYGNPQRHKMTHLPYNRCIKCKLCDQNVTISNTQKRQMKNIKI